MANLEVLKLLDFGLAAHAGQETRLCYSPGYAAPKVLDGGTPDEQSDLYSLGAVLYFMVADHTPPLGKNPADEPKLTVLPPALLDFVLRLLGSGSAAPFASARAALTALAKLKAIRNRKPPSNPWVWLTVGLSATLGVLVAGWLLVRAEQARNVERIRTTEVELERALGDLSEAVKELDAARAIDLHGQADAAARVDAVRRFGDAMNRYNSAKARIDDSRRVRAGLLDRLGLRASRDATE